MEKRRSEHLFDILFTVLLFVLVVGTPLIFTSLTRSVFEVNKMLLLRGVTIITYVVWLFRYLLFKANGLDHTEEKSYSFFGLRWKKIGLEIPLILWIVINILSTVFSQNVRVSIIGAYDRWEGIITVVNYVLLLLMFAKLVRKRFQLNWLLAGLIVPTAISAIYGVFQSLGVDFMNWSVDPTQRVFACINNPVHFCAYVGMIVPVGFGWLLSLSGKNGRGTDEEHRLMYRRVFYLSAYLLLSLGLSGLLNLLFQTWHAIFFGLVASLLSGGILVAIRHYYPRIFPVIFHWTMYALLFICFAVLSLKLFYPSYVDLISGIASTELAPLQWVFFTLGLLLFAALAVYMLYLHQGRRWELLQQASQKTLPPAYHFWNIIKWLVFAGSLLFMFLLSSLFPAFPVWWISLFLILSWAICFSYTTLIPSFREIISWLVFIAFIFIVQHFVKLSGASWITFSGITAIYYVVAPLPNWETSVKRLLFLLTALIFYTQFLSFSRATWVGFIGAMTLFYLIATDNFNTRSDKEFIKDFFMTSAGIAVFYLPALFNLHQKSLVYAAVLIAAVILFILYFVYRCVLSRREQLTGTDIMTLILFPMILGIVYMDGLVFLDEIVNGLFSVTQSVVSTVLEILLGLYFIRLCTLVSDNVKPFAIRLTVIMIFLMLQFVSLSLTNLFLYGTLLTGLLILFFRGNRTMDRETKFWLFTALCAFGIILAVPTLPAHLNKLFDFKSARLAAVANVQYRVETYSRDALTGTARTSMWKSAIPWFQDYWLLGSGPDTVKYMYPVYRRPEYGILEGGHNFTPDRLHNEYINTLATKGIFAFIIYYFGVILGWYFMVLRGVFNFGQHPRRYILVGLMTGATVYLGQVMFNFGVVATLVLFYVLMGLAMAVSRHPDFMPNEGEK